MATDVPRRGPGQRHRGEDPDGGVHVLDPVSAPAGVARIARHIYAGPRMARAVSAPAEPAQA